MSREASWNVDLTWITMDNVDCVKALHSHGAECKRFSRHRGVFPLKPAEFLLEELKALCEHSARRIVSVANVAKMLLAAERYQADTLKTACLSFVQKNMPEVMLFILVYSCSISGQKGIKSSTALCMLSICFLWCSHTC